MRFWPVFAGCGKLFLLVPAVVIVLAAWVQCKSIATEHAAAWCNPACNLAAGLRIMVAVFAIHASWHCLALLLLLLLSE